MPVRMKVIPPPHSRTAAVPSAHSSLSAADSGFQGGISQGLGFDSFNVLSVEDMKSWWDHSPYYDAGFYLPYSPNRHNDPSLANAKGKPVNVEKGKAWLSGVTAQGWGVWPIWFGLQAPCVQDPSHLMPSHFSTDEKTAADDGSKQADLAHDIMTDLGLEGTVLYIDIEPYASSAQCSKAVTAYVGGFVAEMHKLTPGGSLGVYASVWATPSDIYNASPRPDDIWVANNSGNRVTDWNLGMGWLDKPPINAKLTDILWPKHQRMHRYHLSIPPAAPFMETWGGAGPYGI
ncbi:MAG: glycoside hydrolase domain-containing protein, partial [Terracidiphilus sp.]